jgi:hypothetical protein
MSKLYWCDDDDDVQVLIDQHVYLIFSPTSSLGLCAKIRTTRTHYLDSVSPVNAAGLAKRQQQKIQKILRNLRSGFTSEHPVLHLNTQFTAKRNVFVHLERINCWSALQHISYHVGSQKIPLGCSWYKHIVLV